MAIERWLAGLPRGQDKHVRADTEILAGRSYPFLSPGTVAGQVAALSRHLGGAPDDLRRAVIRYSLYARQLDAIQETAVRAICRADCERPPLGCCNQGHHQILSLSDCLFSRPSSLALRLAGAIHELQRREDAFHRQEAAEKCEGLCRFFSPSGCTLKLFKSPLCLHYLCGKVEGRLRETYQEQAEAFVGMMGAMARLLIGDAADFMRPGLIEAALFLGATEA
jgi:hypothetical protein